MLRFVTGPGRTLVADLEARLPGRGIWLSAKGDVIETARVTGRLARAAQRVAGGPVTIPEDLLTRLREGLVRRIVRLLGLARRAGQVVADPGAAGPWPAAGRTEPGWEGEPQLIGVPAAVLAEVFGAGATGPLVMRPGRLATAVRYEVERLVGLGLDGSGLGRDERVHDGRQ